MRQAERLGEHVDVDFETTDQDEALDYVKRVYDCRFDAIPTSEPFQFTHRRLGLGSWTSDAVRCESGGFSAEPYGVVSVCRLRGGRALLTTPRDALSLRTGDIFVMSDATEPFTIRAARADCTMVRLPVDALERAAAEHSPVSRRPRFALLSRRPVTGRAGLRLARVTAFVQRHLTESDPVTAAMTHEAVTRLLAATVLTTFRNTLVRETAVAEPRTDVPATVASALEFIAHNADLHITSSDIAAYAGVSVRALQMAFRASLATSPYEYLRHHRLARVHEELTEATPGDGTSVTQVAQRWQFTDPSRLAAYYRQVYGELPSHTLRHR